MLKMQLLPGRPGRNACTRLVHLVNYARNVSCCRSIERFARGPSNLYSRHNRHIFGFGAESQEAVKSAEHFYRSIQDLHEATLKPINSRLLGPLERNIDEMIPLPMVLLLGNHSSGKSTFINWATGRQIQSTGVAPTDDSFTLIASGNADADTDGPSVIGDPSLGLGGLRMFGSHLSSHLALKIRSDLLLPGLMLIDSPGMIDAAQNSQVGVQVGPGGINSKDRGYDFRAVVSWFAQRADVILLFQDPAKPGTTGETLDVMTTALAGLEYKMSIILNKADSFTTVHDFARAYGALCWNLAKVIPRKDLPKIYTMAVPVTSAGVQGDGKPTPLSAATTKEAAVTHPDRVGAGTLLEAAGDLAAARNEILAEVKRAPLRRVDNLVTRLYDSARLLHMHASVLAAVRKDYVKEIAKHVAVVASGVGALAGLSAGLAMLSLGEMSTIAGVAAAIAAGGGGLWSQRQLQRRASYIAEGPGLDEAFRRAHYLQLADRDEFVQQLYERCRPQLQTTLRTLGIFGLPAVKRSELQALDAIVNDKVPALRKDATKAGLLQGQGMPVSNGKRASAV